MKRLFTRNLGLKVLALVFSATLWFFVAGQKDTEVSFFVPLGFVNMPSGLVLAGNPPGEVEVRLVGSRFLLERITPSQVVPELDLTDALPGLETYRLSSAEVTVPAGVEVQWVSPSTFDLRLERLTSTELRVEPIIKGVPGEGFRVAETVVTPARVTARGGESELKGLEAVRTSPVDIEGADSTREFRARLEAPKRKLKGLSTESVTVKVVIIKENG